MIRQHNVGLSPNKQALLKIRELKTQLAQARTVGLSGPIAVVSMACRFPRRSATPEDFWQSLMDMSEQIGDVPRDRWDIDAFYDDDPEVPGKMYVRRGAFLDSIDQMDPEFFGISPREATWVDPQQRLLMEVGFEALERAGWPAEKISERAGVFVGWMHNDYQNEASDYFLNLNPYIATGAAGSFLSGRLAHYLGLRGPSLAVDTACSSSLVALHIACRSLHAGDCDRALVGGVNAIVSPTTNILTCKLKALSPEGNTKAFAAGADGYVRGEGCGLVTLRRLADAERDGDPILAVIRGSAVGHNGAGSGLTVPNPKAQEDVIRQALEQASVSPAEVSYLEAHGTSTELGDPIELQAAAAALGYGRDPDHPLLIGSVKTNIGHLEAAAGIAGLIKVLLAMQHDCVPPQLNFDVPNPHIPWDRLPVRVVTEATQWPNERKKVANVSAFGMSGTNAHVVLEGYRQSAPRKLHDVGSNGASSNGSQNAKSAATPPRLYVVSGKSQEGAKRLAAKVGRQIAAEDNLQLKDVEYTLGVGRSHMRHRIAVVAKDRVEASDGLRGAGAAARIYSETGRRSPRVAWQFTGQGSQYVGMASGLYGAYPVFAAAIDYCDSVVLEQRGESLKEVLFHQESKLNHTSWTQPGLFAIQMGLSKLLESWGMRPAAVLGHSVGQFAAASISGVMTWEDGLRLICERGSLIGKLPSGGRMLAVFAPVADVAEAIENYAEVSLAAMNGTHTVVSGVETLIDAIDAEFRERGVRTKQLTTSHAFHSPLMEPAAREFESAACGYNFRASQLPLVCNVTGKVVSPEQVLDAGYWAEHILRPVMYADSITALQDLECDLLLEIGPQAVLTSMAAATWKQGNETLISCLDRKTSDAESLMQAVGRLYVEGVTPDFQAMHDPTSARRVVLPTYPFQRRRFWGPAKPAAAHSNQHSAHPLLGEELSLAGPAEHSRFESFIEEERPGWLADHKVMGSCVLPAAAYVEMAFAAGSSKCVKDLTFEQPLVVTQPVRLQSVFNMKQDNPSTIEVYSSATDSEDWKRHFTGKLAPMQEGELGDRVDIQKIAASCPNEVLPEQFYERLRLQGLEYGSLFQTVRSLRHSDSQVLAQLRTTGDIRGYHIAPPLLDGALHCMAAGSSLGENEMLLPVGIECVTVFRPIEDECWCCGQWLSSEADTLTSNLDLLDGSGEVLARIDGLRVRRVRQSAIRKLSGSRDRLIYEVAWQDFDLPAASIAKTNWLVISQEGSTADVVNHVEQQLAKRGHRVAHVTLAKDAAFQELDAQRFIMSGAEADDWQTVLDRLSAADSELDGIAWFIRDEEHLGESDSALPDQLKQAQTDCTGLLQLIHAIHASGRRDLPCGLQLITAQGVAVEPRVRVKPASSQFWGIGRVIAAEDPGLRCRLIDWDGGAPSLSATASSITDILLTETQDSQFAIREHTIHVPRLQRGNDHRSTESIRLRSEGCYLITGGLGGLGLQAAAWLAQIGATQIVLVSRRAPNDEAESQIRSIRKNGCDVVVVPADISKRQEVSRLLSRFGSDFRPLAGVIHAAGMLDDGLLQEQNWERFARVLAPKVLGASLLDELTETCDLDFFILYSSAASVLGSPGQSNYAMANAYLDGLAWRRSAAGKPALSINWGPWSQGMADDERIAKRLALQGITPLSSDEAHQAMASLLTRGMVQATVIDADWRRLGVGYGHSAQTLLANLLPNQSASNQADSAFLQELRQKPGKQQREIIVDLLQAILAGILGTSGPPERDRPLIEMGLDSLMAVEFGTALHQSLGERFVIGPTTLFDYPTIDDLAEHLLEIAQDNDEAQSIETLHSSVTESSSSLPSAGERDGIAIVGMSCRFPGARDVAEFWNNLLNQVDSVGEVPPDRWDVERFYSRDRIPGKMYSRSGGFVEDIDEFDAAFFNISDQEACWIDPQHRLLLEQSYLALEDAGMSSQPADDPNVGVFMGIMGQDYAFLPTLDDADVVRAFQGAGLSHSAGVGRINYHFGFEGPSVAVDTASSSSLVAVIQAMRSLQDRNCNVALAGGVNAILAPVNSLLMSSAGLLSSDGRCKSFSASADGFGRGEGCGVVVLKRLEDAERDGDRIFAVLRGGAIVHNGFSSGITAPNGRAQTRVISEALKDAGIAPSRVQYLEAHGTGTQIGDPIEISACASVYGKGRTTNNPLLVGSVKSNISHLEAAGGISGLIKTVLAIDSGTIPPQLHFEEPNQHVPWNRLPIQVVTETTKWPDTEERLAGVTALGLVGTNAHVVVGGHGTSETESHTGATGMQSQRPTDLMVMSARTDQALHEMARRYRDYLSCRPNTSLAYFCYTLAVGRRHHEHRTAFPATSIQDCIAKLQDFVGASSTNGDTHDRILTSKVSEPPKLAWVFTRDDHSTLLAGRQLFKAEIVFRKTVELLNDSLKEHAQRSDQATPDLLKAFTEEDANTVNTAVQALVLQAGLSKLWQSWGIEPDLVCGDGVGQYAAAAVAGGLSFEDAVILVHESDQIRQHLDSVESSEAREILDRFEAVADTMDFYPPNLPLVCSLEGEIVPIHRSLAGSYWKRHCVESPAASDFAEFANSHHCDALLAVGPSIESQSSNHSVRWLASLERSAGAVTSMQEALGSLYQLGCNPDFTACYPPKSHHRLRVPTYPFERQRYWITEVSRYVQNGSDTNHSEIISSDVRE